MASRTASRAAFSCSGKSLEKSDERVQVPGIRTGVNEGVGSLCVSRWVCMSEVLVLIIVASSRILVGEDIFAEWFCGGKYKRKADYIKKPRLPKGQHFETAVKIIERKRMHPTPCANEDVERSVM